MDQELVAPAGPRFSVSTRMVEEFVTRFPESGEGSGADKLNEKPIHFDTDPVIYRTIDRMIVFQCACDADIETEYFVDSRVVPIFCLGVGSDENLNPPPFDEPKPPKRFYFFRHDLNHATFMQGTECSIYLQTGDLRYKMIEYRDRWSRMKNGLAAINDVHKVMAAKRIMFQYTHENTGIGGFNYDLRTFKNKSVDGVIQRCAQEILISMNVRNFHFSNPEAAKQIEEQIPEAANWLTAFFTKELTMPNTSDALLQETIDREVQEAAKNVSQQKDRYHPND